MPRNSFVQMNKLTNVSGRITYISSKAKQENLYATYTTVSERSFWRELAKCNQKSFRQSGTEGQCIEARELIIYLGDLQTILSRIIRWNVSQHYIITSERPITTFI